MYEILIPMVSMGGLGAAVATVLVIADRRLRVKEDPRISAVYEILPGANCGACGLPGCRQFAEAVVSGNKKPIDCPAGGPDTVRMIGDVLGIKVDVGLPVRARVMCLGGDAECGQRSEYKGVKDCRAAALVSGGSKSCIYGCLGYGSCAVSCPFDAIVMSQNGLPKIDDRLCTGCGICVDACPKNIITMVAEGDKIFLGCSSPERGKSVKKICSRGCIGCVLCAKVCPPVAIEMVDNLPIINQDKCDDCGICIDKCPTDSLLRPEVKLVLHTAAKKKAV